MLTDPAQNQTSERTTIARLIEDKGTAVSTVAPGQSAVEAAQMMADERIGVLVCCDDPTVVCGIISERDIVRAFAEQSDRVANLRVSDLMTQNVELCQPIDDLRSVMKRMKRGGFRHIPVVDEGRLRGLVSVTDVLNFYIRNTDLGDRQAIVDLVFESGLVYPGG